ncbi:MAG: PIN domain nuclease [Ignavibacteriae bacterium]|nr:PIN domain nuclease [Ignavibacteriota bacterium]NOG99069.1 PIN domain nuclease [Ignavibacteriota bacterium]
MIFLDSTVLIDYFNGNKNWQVEFLDESLGNELVVIGDYVITEVLQGFRSEKDFQKAKTTLLLFPCFDIGGKDIAIQSAKNYRYLRKKGLTVRKTIDVMIATFCIENNLMLLHNDKDFEPFTKYLKLKVYEK